MVSGPVMIQALEGENAILKNRELMGATDPKKAEKGTIRADFADSIDANAVHGSDAAETAAVEVARSEEHTSELQSPCNLVCRLLLEKKQRVDRNMTRCAEIGPPSDKIHEEHNQRKNQAIFLAHTVVFPHCLLALLRAHAFRDDGIRI